MTAVCGTVAKAHDDVGMAVAFGVLKRDQKSTGRRRVVAVIAAAPGIDVDNPVWGHDQVPGVADIVRKHGSAEPARQRDPAIVAGQASALRARRVGLSLRKGWRAGRQHQSDDRKSRRSPAKADMTIFHDASLNDLASDLG